MFARRLGLKVGRLDWWNIRGEHTPYEWATQIAAEQVDPTGDHRADLRGAMLTANLMAMQAHKKIDPEDFRQMVKALMEYLPGKEAYEEADDLRAVRLLQQKQKGE